MPYHFNPYRKDKVYEYTGRKPKDVVFPFGLTARVVHAGGYHNKPTSMVGVKMAAEIDKEHDINIPTEDFSVPDVAELKAGIRDTLRYLAKGHHVYVGCMGGVGRTGLFLAALAKTLGNPNPISWVRVYYSPSAVETRDQEDFIHDLDVTDLKWAVLKAKALAVFTKQRSHST